MYDEIIEALKESLEKAINYYKSELSTIRAGRANPRILDKVMVNYYGNMTPLRQMANVSAPEARMLLISLWDTGALRDVIKALNDANLGLSPSDDGKIIRLVFPVLTEERRKDYVKSVKRMAEEAKNNFKKRAKRCY